MRRLGVIVASTIVVAVWFGVLCSRAMVSVEEGSAVSERSPSGLERILGPSRKDGPGVTELWILPALSGQVEPCQCQIENLGDIANQVGMLKRRREERKFATLYIGALFPPGGQHDRNDWRRRWDKLKASTIVRMLAVAQPSAIAPGWSDWNRYRSELRELAMLAPDAVICSNLRQPGSTSSWVVTETAGARLMIGAIVLGGDSAQFTDPVAAAAKIVKHAERAGCIAVVAVSFPSLADSELVDEVVRASGNSPVVLAGPQVGTIMNSNLDPLIARRDFPVIGGRPRGQAWASLEAIVADRTLPWRSASTLASLKSVWEMFESPGSVRESIGDAIRAETLKLRRSTPCLNTERPVLRTQFADEAVSREVEEYRAKRERLLAKISVRSPDRKFRGAHTCRQCHQRIVESWAATAHAHAMESIGKRGRRDEPACIVCHTTGYLQPGGYSDRRDSRRARSGPDLAAVQCEACHGPAGDHPDDARMAKPNELTCLSCHDELNSPKFDFKSYLAQVDCSLVLPTDRDLND